MVLNREITARIKEELRKHPQGLSITELVQSVDINRNTAGRYLENLLLSGQVEMRHFGMAKIYSLTDRLPVSSVLSISSEFVIQLDSNLRVNFANDPLLAFIGVPAKDLIGKNIEYTPFAIVFEDIFSELLDQIRKGLKGEEWRGELSRPVKGVFFFCRIAPTVFNEGTKGVSILLEDISDRKRDEVRIRESESRLRSIFKVSPVGIGVVSNNIILEVNDRLCQITGYTAGELVGNSARMLFPTQEAFDRVGILNYCQIQQNGSGSIETRWVKKDGTVIDILLSSTPLDPADISGGITFTALDFTERKQAERALMESEAKLQLALSVSEMGMWEMDVPSFKGSIDERAAAVLGYQKSDIGSFRADWDALSHPDDVPLIHQRLADYLEGRASIFESEHRMRHTSGRWIWVVGRGKITWSLRDGSCKRVSGTLQDITERKQAEQALRESEDRYRKLVEISPNAVLLHRDGKIIYVNPATTRLLGARQAGEITGKNVLDFIHPDYRDAVRTNIEKDLTGKSTPVMELQMLRTNGTPVVVEGRGVATSIGGSPAVLVAVNDITERYRAGLALKMSEERYRSVFENTGAATLILEENTIISLVNDEFERLSGYTKEEIEMKKSWTEFIVKEDLEHMLAHHYLRRERGKTPRQYEFGVRIKNGDIRHALITVDLIPGTTQTIASIIDITDRKVAEQTLQASEAKYRNLMDIAQEGIWTIDPDGITTYVNKKMSEMLGCTVSDMIGRPMFQFMDQKGSEIAARNYPEYSKGVREQVEFEFIKKDGTRLIALVSNTSLFDTSGKFSGAMAVITDITDRRQAETALRESECRYRTLAEASQDLIFLIDRDDNVEYVNSYAAAILGFPANQVIGKKRSSLFSNELGHRQAQGLRWVLETGKAWHSEGAMDISGTLHWFDHYLMPITDAHGMVTSVLGVSRDMTDRKKAEDALRASEERYRCLLEQSFDAVAIHKDKKIASLNERAARILGAAAPGDLTGRSIFKLIHPDSCRDLLERIRMIDADPGTPAPVLREKFFRADGTIVTVDVMALRITDNGLPAIQVMFREVPSPETKLPGSG